MQLKKTNPEPGHEAFQKTNIIEVMKKVLPEHAANANSKSNPKSPSFEDAPDLLARKKVIDEFLKEHLRCNPLPEGKKIAVVCHSTLIAALTSKGLDPSTEKGLKDYTWTANCQLLPYLNM